MTPTLDTLAVGDTVVETTVRLSRDSLVRYAGASGDFNPIHYNDAFAAEVGLDGVIAHGMLTMASVIAPVIDVLGDPGLVLAYETRFTKPVLVPALGEAHVQVLATVGAIDAEAGTLRIDLTVTSGDLKVLTKSRATVVRP